jgi:hypothetical protein
MSDGRIQRQGTVEELKKQGLIDYIAQDVAHQQANETAEGKGTGGKTQEATDERGKPKQAKKLIEEEVQSEGNVKWPIYKTYLKAS